MSASTQAIIAMESLRPESLRTRLASFGRKSGIPILLGMILAGVIAVAGLVYTSVDRELTVVALMRQESVANLAAAILSEKFARLADIGVSLATRVRVRQFIVEDRWSEAIEDLRDVPQNLPVIDRLFLANADGTLMADLPRLPGAVGRNLAHRDWYKGFIRRGKPYVSEVYTGSAAPRLNVFAVAVPISTSTGGLVAILVLQVHLDSAFFAWTREMDPGPEGGTYIVDQRGRVAFDSKSPTGGEIVDLSGTPTVQALMQGKEGVHIAIDPASGQETIFAYASDEPHGWGVVMHQPALTSLGLLARDHQLRRLSIAYALLLVLGLSMGYLAYRLVMQRRLAREHVLANAELESRVVERTVQLQAANKELEAFSYSVSHDLRAPLRSLDGFAMVLIEDYGEKLDADGKDALERIRAASQRMGNLIDDLLRLSHVTRAELHLKSMDLSALAHEIADALAADAPERSVQWSIEEGMNLRADPALIRIALQNLVQNAWKFTGKTERAAIHVGTLHRDAQTIYFVADNGAGFDMTHATRLFSAFQRLHHSGDFPGTGIGLAIVRRIMNRHDGEIWAEAKEGEGATFFFAFKEFEEGPR